MEDFSHILVKCIKYQGRAVERIVSLERFIDESDECECDNLEEASKPCFSCFINQELGGIRGYLT